MPSLLARLRTLAAWYPSLLAWAVNGGAALVAAYAFNATKTEEAAVTTICVALAAAYVAVRARPVAWPALLGALVTGITAAGAFGLHPSARLLAMLVALGSVAGAAGFHAAMTPVAKIRQAKVLLHAAGRHEVAP